MSFYSRSYNHGPIFYRFRDKARY